MLSFRFASILLAAAIRVVVAADGPPEFATPDVFVSTGDPGTTLKPYVGNPVKRDDAIDEIKAIRGLLMTRQSGCQAGYGVCNDGGCVSFSFRVVSG